MSFFRATNPDYGHSDKNDTQVLRGVCLCGLDGLIFLWVMGRVDVCVCEENAENTSPHILDSLTDGVDTAPEQLVSRAAASSVPSVSMQHHCL